MEFERVLMHLRKSRADLEAEARGEGETLAKHKKVLLKFAKEKNLNIINIREELESGESLIHRPKMLQTLSEVEQGFYDAVLCIDIDRLGRGDMQDQGLILKTFKNSKTKIITPRKLYNLDYEWDEEYVEFEEFMARKEYKFIKRRLQNGRLGSIDNGNYLGTKAPFGYQIKKEGKGIRYLIPDPEQASIVKMIFEWYTSDDPQVKMGSSKIANELNRLTYKTATGKKWDPSSVLFILKNAVYAGRIQWRKKDIKKSVTPGKKKDTRTRPRSEWIDVKGKHEPLVSMETFQKAQNILKRKYHVPYQLENGLSNPLAGIIRCDMCGSSMVLRPYSHQQYPHLICHNRHCPNKSSRFMYVEERLIQGLREWLAQYKADWKRTQKISKRVDPSEFLKKSLDKLNRDLAEINEQKNRLHDLLEQGVYSIDTFLERSNILAERNENILKAIDDVQSRLKEEKNLGLANEKVIPMLENIIDVYYKTEDPVQKNNLLKSVLNYATYRKEKYQRDDDFTLVLYPKLLREVPLIKAQK